MSNTTITVNEAAEAARLADIRAQEEAERRARIERERSAHARHQILAQEDRLRSIQNRLDAAASRLPDLRLPPPFNWPEAPGESAGAAALESHLNRVRGYLDTYSLHSNMAIDQAERLLQRRQATAAAWHASQDAEAQWRMNHQALIELGQRLGQAMRTEALPERPSRTAELEVVENHVARMMSAISRQSLALAALRAQARNLARAGKMAGTAVTGVRSGEQALAEFGEEAVAAARARFEHSLQIALSTHALRGDELPPGVKRLVEGARQSAAERDWSIPLSDWMARESARRRDTAKARMMLSSPPEGALEDSGLTQRWHQLTPRLQAVMAGHEPMTGDLEGEYAQLGRDAQRTLNYRLSRAACLARLAREGMEVVEREDGEGLVVIDLSRPETWLEVQEYEGENGEFAATFVLKTDAPEGSFDEEAQTASVCERLGKVTEGSDKVRSNSEVVERKSRITRDRKPALKARAMQI